MNKYTLDNDYQIIEIGLDDEDGMTKDELGDIIADMIADRNKSIVKIDEEVLRRNEALKSEISLLEKAQLKLKSQLE